MNERTIVIEPERGIDAGHRDAGGIASGPVVGGRFGMGRQVWPGQSRFRLDDDP